MAIKTRGDIIRLVTVHNADLCQFLQQMLEDEGIRCRVVGEYLYPGFTGETSWPELWVGHKDAARAQEVLRAAKRDRGWEYVEEDEPFNEHGLFKAMRSLARKLPRINLFLFLGMIIAGIAAVIIAAILSTHS